MKASTSAKKDNASKRKPFVQLYSIQNGNVKHLQHEDAFDTDFWRTMTLTDHYYYDYICKDFLVLSVKIEDLEHMIELRGYSIEQVFQLLHKYDVLRYGRMPHLKCLIQKHFHNIPNPKLQKDCLSMPTSFELYVSFYGLRLISALINEEFIGGNTTLLLKEIFKRNLRSRTEEEFVFIEDQQHRSF